MVTVLRALWTITAFAACGHLACRPRGALFVSTAYVSHFAYLGVSCLLIVSIAGVWIHAWSLRRGRAAGLLVCLTPAVLVGVASDFFVGRWQTAVFERQVDADWRYRTYVRGWLQDDRYLKSILRHDKQDASIGPYTAGFCCKMLDSDFIVGPDGFRRHSERPISADSQVILCLGGSTTFGMTVQPADLPYPDILEDMLAGMGPSFAAVRVVNTAVPGMGIGRCIKRLHTCRQWAPKAAVFYEAINSLPWAEPRRPKPRNSGLASWVEAWLTRARSDREADRYTGETYKSEVRRLVETCRSLKVTPILVTFALAYSAEDGRETLRYYDVMQNGQGSAYAAARIVERHNQRLREVAAETGVRCVDLAAELTGREELFIDACHFTHHGNQVLAARLAPVVAEELIETRLGPAPEAIRDLQPAPFDSAPVQ